MKIVDLNSLVKERTVSVGRYSWWFVPWIDSQNQKPVKVKGEQRTSRHGS